MGKYLDIALFPHLIWIALQAAVTPLPRGWEQQPVEGEHNKVHYVNPQLQVHNIHSTALSSSGLQGVCNMIMF